MKSISGKTLCKIVERNGWELKRVTGSHHIYAKEGVISLTDEQWDRLAEIVHQEIAASDVTPLAEVFPPQQ